MACPLCDNPDCPGENELREFSSWVDLAAHADEKTLVAWVNHYARMIESRDEAGARYRKKQQILAKVAKKYLDQDELERVVQLSQER